MTMNMTFLWKAEFSQRYSNFPDIYEDVGQVLLADSEHNIKSYVSHDLETGEVLWEKSCIHEDLSSHGLLLNRFFLFDGRPWDSDDDLWGDLLVMDLNGKCTTYEEVRFGFSDHLDGRLTDCTLNIYDPDDMSAPVAKPTLLDQIKECTEIQELYAGAKKISAYLNQVHSDRYLIRLYANETHHLVSVKRQEELEIEYILKGEEKRLIKPKEYLIISDENEASLVHDITTGELLFSLDGYVWVQELEDGLVMHDTQSKKFYRWEKETGLQGMELEDTLEDPWYHLTENYILETSGGYRKKLKLAVRDFSGKLIHYEEFSRGHELYSCSPNHLALYKAGEIHFYSMS